MPITKPSRAKQANSLTVASTSASRLSNPQKRAISSCSTGEMLLWRGSKLRRSGVWCTSVISEPARLKARRLMAGKRRAEHEQLRGGCGARRGLRRRRRLARRQTACLGGMCGWLGLPHARCASNCHKINQNCVVPGRQPPTQGGFWRLTGRWASAPARRWDAWLPSATGPGCHGWPAARSLRGQGQGRPTTWKPRRQRRRRRQRRQGTQGGLSPAAARDLDGTAASPSMGRNAWRSPGGSRALHYHSAGPDGRL